MLESLIARKFGSFILDESHYLKNGDAKRTQNVSQLVSSARDSVLLLLSVETSLCVFGFFFFFFFFFFN